MPSTSADYLALVHVQVESNLPVKLKYGRTLLLKFHTLKNTQTCACKYVLDACVWVPCEVRVIVHIVVCPPRPCRYGKEDKLVNLFGIMQALVSFVQDDKDNLRSAFKYRPFLLCKACSVHCTVYMYMYVRTMYMYMYVCSNYKPKAASDLRNQHAALVRGSNPHVYIVQVLMRDGKEERSKQGQTNNNYTAHLYWYCMYTCMCLSLSLRSIVAGRHRFVFVCRGPLVFVAVARSKLSESQVS